MAELEKPSHRVIKYRNKGAYIRWGTLKVNHPRLRREKNMNSSPLSQVAYFSGSLHHLPQFPLISSCHLGGWTQRVAVTLCLGKVMLMFPSLAKAW